MYEQIKIMLANLNSNMKIILHENEELRKLYQKVLKENEELKRKLDNKETT